MTSGGTAGSCVINVTVTNFLGGSGHDVADLMVVNNNDPQAALTITPPASTFRWQTFRLQSNLFFRTCSGADPSIIRYRWTVTPDNFNLASVLSSEASTLVLPAFTVGVGTYTFRLEANVTDNGNTVRVSQTQSITVPRSDPVALLQGLPSSRSTRQSESIIVLSAAASYNPDCYLQPCVISLFLYWCDLHMVLLCERRSGSSHHWHLPHGQGVPHQHCANSVRSD